MLRQWMDWGFRYGTISLVFLLTLASLVGLISHHWLWLGVPFSALGAWDWLQSRHSLMRNYPLIARLRWVFEELRPFLRQYIEEGDLSERPYNRDQRSLVYARAKGDVDAQPFGTELDVYGDEFEMVSHSMVPTPVPEANFRVDVGSSQCAKPYSASVLNISAMSFGALGANAIEALNLGARRGGFYHDTGEGAISPYHRKHGGDLVWELGSGYFGCRDGRGRFDPGAFSEQAQSDQVKMIEIKLSQGAKPGHGGVLPGAKVTPEIAATRRIPVAEDCVSPAHHTAFSNPIELLEFAASLRELSGGKPVGAKFCVGHPWEVFALCKAMLKTGIRLDFLVVDGKEGGTGAAPEEFSDHIGMPLREGLILTRNALVGAGLKDEIRLAASGKVYSAFSIASNLALGADWCNAARAFMFALGCVMSQRCHTGKCPTGVTTHDPQRQRGLVIPEKSERVESFHHKTLERLAEMVAAAGLQHPTDFQPHHLYRRLDHGELVQANEIYTFLEKEALVNDASATPYGKWWQLAQAESFRPLAH